MTTTSKYISFIMITALLATILIIANFRTEGEYVGGNVLHLPHVDNTSPNKLSFPWKNNSIAAGLLFRTLFLPESDLETFSPDLATTYDISADELTYVITLKEWQQWSDGKPITPQDIVFSVTSILTTDFPNPIFINAFSKIKSMSISANTVTFQLNEKHSNFIGVLAQFIIVPKHILLDEDMKTFHENDFWKNPVVSGMYKIEEIKDGKYFRLTRNNYYGGTSPKIETVMVYLDHEGVNFDYVSTNSLSDIIYYKSLRGYKEYQTLMLFYRYFVFNMEGSDGFRNSTMQDFRLRKALSYAINQEKIVENFDLQFGPVKKNTVHDALMYRNYDPERAKELLAEVNYDFSRPLRIIYYYTDKSSKYFIQQIAHYLEDIGLTVELIQSTGVSDLYEKREYDILLKGLASFNISEWFLEYSSQHFLTSLFGNKGEFDSLLARLTAENDKTKIAEIIDELSNLEREKFYKIPIVILNQSVNINTDRVKVPSNIIFGNDWYLYNRDFANWEIIKK